MPSAPRPAIASPAAAARPIPTPTPSPTTRRPTCSAQREVFDVTKEPAADQDRYGKHEFGQHCLLARRLLEHGVPFVQVNHSNYDTHFENFDFHIEQLGEFDQPFATLVADLADRGLLGRHADLRDVGIRPHAEDQRPLRPRPLGHRLERRSSAAPASSAARSSARRTTTAPRSPTAKSITATCSTRCSPAVGVDSKGEFDIGGRKFPVADPAKGPIKELLA